MPAVSVGAPREESARLASSEINRYVCPIFPDAPRLLMNDQTKRSVAGNTKHSIAAKRPPPQPSSMTRPELKELKSVDQCLASPGRLPSRNGHTSKSLHYMQYDDIFHHNIRQSLYCRDVLRNHTQPCKLTTHLAANPGADATHMLVTVDGTDDVDGVDGAECSRAYRIPMPFAAAQQKMSFID